MRAQSADERRTAALWEDARAALTAAVITRGLTVGADTVVRFERKLDVQRLARALRESRGRCRRPMDHPFRSLPAEVLSVGGYITVNQDGSTDYYAPDADVLLSDTFLADHCFKIEPRDEFEHLGQVGLAFQPIPERKKPDIKGVLWMDEKTAELRTLEFTYTWLPNDLRTARLRWDGVVLPHAGRPLDRPQLADPDAGVRQPANRSDGGRLLHVVGRSEGRCWRASPKRAAPFRSPRC